MWNHTIWIIAPEGNCDSRDHNIKASLQITLYACVEICGSGSVFATRTSRFNKLKAPLRLCGALQLAPPALVFLFFYFLLIPDFFSYVLYDDSGVGALAEQQSRRDDEQALLGGEVGRLVALVENQWVSEVS